VTHRLAGLAASAVVAYQREVGRARAAAERATRPEPVDAYVGEVGKRETFLVTLDFVTGFETDYGYTTVLKFKTTGGAAPGATLVWKASADPKVARDDVGKAYVLTGSVKKHDEYKGRKQTILSRCSLVEGTEIPPPPVKAKRARRAKASANAVTTTDQAEQHPAAPEKESA
jgi:hypothetical protein